MDTPSEEKYITIGQAAEYLKVSENTIHRWIRQGVIPVYKIDNVYNFKKDEILAWARYKNIGLGQDVAPSVSSEPVPEEEVTLIQAVSNGGIHYGLSGNDPVDIYEKLVKSILFEEYADLTSDADMDLLLSSLIEREQLASTGLGSGIAIPHPRKPSDWGLDQPLCSIVFLESPVDFQAIDGEPVHVLFVILCSTVKGHLRLLSQVSRMIHTKEMQDFFRSIPDKEKIMSKIIEISNEAGN